MKALWLATLVALTAAAAVVADSSTKKLNKKEAAKKDNIQGSDLHKKLFHDSSSVKKAIAQRSEDAQADESGLFRRLQPIKDAVAFQSQKSTEAQKRPTKTKNSVGEQRVEPSKGVLAFPLLDFSATPIGTRDEGVTATTQEPLDSETDAPVLLTRSALMKLLNISADNLDKELKTITVGSTGITIGGFDPFKNVLTGTGTGTGIGIGIGTGTGTGTGTATLIKPSHGVSIALPDFASIPLLGLVGAADKGTIGAALATLFTIAAAIGAGLASLIAFVVPPLQIANQVLAIIAISLLIAYVVEDKKGAEEEGYEYVDTGYGSGSGYGYDMGSGLMTYGDTTGYSSYSDYRRSDPFQSADSISDLVQGNTIDGVDPKKVTTLGRSVGLVPMVNSVAKAVSSAVHSYSNMYGENPAQ